MKNRFVRLPLLLVGTFLFFAISCDKEDDNDINGEECVDVDGNIYETVKIGAQEWMAENLKTTTYNDGSGIPNVTDVDEWSELEKGAYAWYDNDVSNNDVYGALYNWYAVETGKLCPDGWRVPTDDDWTHLTDYLGGEDVAAGKLKATGTIEAGTGLWYDPNTGATNETGFTAFPGGTRIYDGTFNSIGYYGNWWSATELSSYSAYDRYMSYYHSNVNSFYDSDKEMGLSVRCLKSD